MAPIASATATASPTIAGIGNDGSILAGSVFGVAVGLFVIAICGTVVDGFGYFNT